MVTLRTTTYAFVYLTAHQFGIEVFLNRKHRIHLLDISINDALRIATGCLKPTPTEYLLVFSGIPPAELCHIAATLSLARRTLEPSHTLYNYINRSTTVSVLSKKNAFVIEAQDLPSPNINASTWIHNNWKEKWTKNTSRLYSCVTDVGPIPTGFENN